MPQSAFQLHPQLAQDCHVLGRAGAIQVLLHKNSSVTWFILVPETEVTELFALPSELRRELDASADHLARRLLAGGADKVNVAAIGNMVPQLHYHVVGRRRDDPAWPGVVWGRLPEAPVRSRDDLTKTIAAYAAELLA